MHTCQPDSAAFYTRSTFGRSIATATNADGVGAAVLRPEQITIREWGMELYPYGKLMRIATPSVAFGILYIASFFLGCPCLALLDSSSRQVGSCSPHVNLVENVIGCMPFNKFLTGSYIEKHNTLPATDHCFLDHDFNVPNCKGLDHKINNVQGVLDVQRHLVGEGSHRRLISTMNFKIQPKVPWFQTHSCDALIIERLPVGVFADPFELQHLVQHQIYLDAAVFGDTNLELPSALSSQSIVEIRMVIKNCNLASGCRIVTELPLHARYPPPDGSGYSRVEIGAPEVLIHCGTKSPEDGILPWTVISIKVGSVNNVTWMIPSGNKEHTGIVYTVTFVSALVSAVLIVLSSMYFSTDNAVKNSKDI